MQLKEQQLAVESGAQLRMSDIISALSFALDLTEGQPMGHSVNCCLLGMKLADVLRLSDADKQELYYALLLKDAGCSSNAARMYEIFGGDEIRAKREIKSTDWSRVTFDGLQYLMRNVLPGKSALERVFAMGHIVMHRDEQAQELMQLRCDRGASIARRLGRPARTAEAIRCLDEHWDGRGSPDGLRGDDIPFFSRIMNLCQTIEVFASINSPEDAMQVIQERKGAWFDPELVAAAKKLEIDDALWKAMRDGTARKRILDYEAQLAPQMIDEAEVDNICEAFAEIIDVKSPYTHAHSRNVTRVALLIAGHMQLPASEMQTLRRAALLHDIGKLSVPNSILDKADKLNAQEWEAVRLHPYYTQRILERIAGFQHLAFIASTHHEKLDGSGYYRNLRASQLPMESRMLTIADIFDALSAKRPYRDAMPMDRVLGILADDVPHALDAECFEALRQLVEANKLPLAG
jgi:HD-GYP domain-containing protein (c-di-GMP phosphodiesterase class II)